MLEQVTTEEGHRYISFSTSEGMPLCDHNLSNFCLFLHFKPYWETESDQFLCFGHADFLFINFSCFNGFNLFGSDYFDHFGQQS